MRYVYDDEADALYIYLREGTAVAGTTVVDEARSIDIDADGKPVGVEVTGASSGVRVLDLVSTFGLEELSDHLRPLEGRSFTAVA